MNFANSLRTSFNTSGHCFWSYLVTEKRTQVNNDIVIIVNGRKSCLEFHKPILQVIHMTIHAILRPKILTVL